MSATADARQQIADALAGGMLNGRPVTVHPVTPKAVRPPCIVLVPADGYLTPVSLRAFTLTLDALCLVSPTDDIGTNLANVETLAEHVITAAGDTYTAGTIPAPEVLTELGGYIAIPVPITATVTIEQE